MPISKVVIIPGAGHFPETGFTRGHSLPHISELDVIDIVTRTFSEALEEFMVQHEVLPTRRHPGLSKAERETVEPCSVAVEIGLSWFNRPRQNNESEIESGVGAVGIAGALAETLTEWGRCCSYGHRTQRPRGINTPGLIRVKLFALNGVDADVYLTRLAQIGREMGQCLAVALR